MFHIVNRTISAEPTKSLGIKTEYTPNVVVLSRLVNIFNCLAYDWTVNDELKVT